MGKKKKLIFVLGMHRSGTSLLTSILQEAGCSLGEETKLLKSAPDNMFGFFENSHIVEVNDEILDSFDCKWNDLTNLPKEIDLNDENLSIIINEVADNLSSKAQVVVFKDPRFCITLPIWKKALSDKYDLHAVAIFRHPYEVFQSLNKREEISKEQTSTLWNTYNKFILSYIKDYKIVKSCVSYEQLINQSQAVIQRVLSSLDINYGREKLIRTSLLIDHKLKRNTASDNDSLPLTQNIYEKLITQESRFIKKFPLRYKKIEVSAKEELEVVTKRKNSLINLVNQIQKDRQKHQKEISRLKSVEYKLLQAEKENKKLHNTNEDLLESLTSTKTELENIKRSKGWKVILRLRELASSFRRS